MSKTTILLPDDLLQRAKFLAKKKGTTLSGMIRKQLEAAVVENEDEDLQRKEDPLFSNWTPSDKAVPADLSSNHDQYLYGQ